MSEMKEFEEKMGKSVDALQEDYATIRAGRANPHILDKIKVDYYGTPTSLQQVANISVPEARMIQIQPWEASLIKDIEKAILVSELGITPNNDGKVIRLVFPELTEDRRKELAKDIKKKGDNAKVAIRNIRRDANDAFKKMNKGGELSDDELKGKEDEVQKLTDKYVDKTTSSVQITNSTSVMMTTVAENKAAIGYISLGSLNDTVKAVKIDGAEASVDTVKDGSYKIVRPFNIVTKDKLSKQAQDFENYIMSADGQKIIQDNGYIKADEKAPAYKSNGAKGKVVVGGSSSVTPVMEKLKEAYAKANKDVTVEVQQSDSTTGVTNAIEGTCDIGMASRDLADSEAKKGVKATVIAKDGIAVIVNKDSKVDELTSAQVKDIYTGKTTKWADIK